MSTPTDRESFKQYCLKKLGAPVIQINVADEQLEDRIDEGLSYFWEYYFDGSDKTYFKYQLTDQDIANRYITMPNNIIGVVNIFDLGGSLNVNNMFNIRYQIALNDLYTLTNVSMTPYYMAMSHIQLIEQLLVGRQPIRYNRHMNRLFIDMDWNLVNAGYYMIVECYQVIDPEQFPRFWSDRWLARYVTCLFKEQWGSILGKYQGIKMPGGQTFNGDKIYNDAIREKAEIEKQLIDNCLPASDMIG